VRTPGFSSHLSIRCEGAGQSGLNTVEDLRINCMRQPRTFLVIAEEPERLSLIATTLHRKFPNSVVQTCRDADPALAVVRAHKLDAIVMHRSSDMDEIPLLEHIRSATNVPIVAVTGYGLETAALAAGAAQYLHVEQWLLIGTVVAELIGARSD